MEKGTTELLVLHPWKPGKPKYLAKIQVFHQNLTFFWAFYKSTFFIVFRNCTNLRGLLLTFFFLENTANRNCKFKGTWNSLVECKKQLNLSRVFKQGLFSWLFMFELVQSNEFFYLVQEIFWKLRTSSKIHLTV